MIEDATDYRRDAWISAGVLAIVLIGVFAQFLFGHKTLLSSAGDVPSIYVDGATVGHPTGHLRGLDQGASGWQTEPAFAAAHHVMVDEHRLPFWDEDGAYGKPSLGAMVPQEFYPLSTIVDLHPTPRVYNWWIVARLFIAGLFAALFVRLFFASRWAAISAGIAAMFTGYFLLYYDMPHLSVEVEIPMLLWATEILARKLTPRRIAALATAVALVVLGGMPESALLALTLSLLYGALRLVTLPGDPVKRIAAGASAYLLGVAVGSIELVPFLELLVRGASDHDPSVRQGLGFDGAWRSGFFTEFFPRVFGDPYANILLHGFGPSGARGFFGMSAFFLAAVAICSAAFKRDKRTAVVAFFSVLAVFFVLKRFGNPLVNWTGGLPLFVQVQFQKYGEAELGCLVAILAGFGVGYVRERMNDRRSIAAAFTIALALVTYLFLATRDLVPDSAATSLYPHSIAFGLIALLITAAAAIAIVSPLDRLRFAGTAAVIAVLVAEPFATYLYPVLFRWSPPIEQNPYAGAPYLTYLQEQTASSRQRIFGVNGLLFPNWASAYHLSDVRSLEAVTLRDYLPFVDAFVATVPATSDDQFDRFVATTPIDMNAPLVQRWLALSSVGYVLSPITGNMIVSPKGSILTPLVAQATQQVAVADAPSIREEADTVRGVSESAFFEHPPRDISFHTAIAAATPLLTADIALNPASYIPVPICGGAVTFTLSAIDGGRSVGTIARTIDPKHVAADRRWIPLSLDLAKSAGHTVDIHFQTSAVDTCAAWALWGEPRFVPSHDAGTYKHNQLIYPLTYQAPGVNIYRIPNPLPRLTLYHSAQPVDSFHDALSILTSPSFDIYHTAVVQGHVPPLAPARGTDSVTVVSARSDRVSATVTTGSAALLMQNDAWYPGWSANVDGNDVPMIRTDGFFRGIPIGPGTHTVVIEYRSTAALIGTVLTLLGTLVLIGLLIDPRPLLGRRSSA